MSRRFLLATAALLTLAACSGESITGLDQQLYNATYSGPARFWYSNPRADVLPVPPGETVTMTLSQLGRDFTGNFTVADSSGQALYTGSVTGRTTSTGADLTFVLPGSCAGTMYGAFTVSNNSLTGGADGRDCKTVALDTGVHITFTNLVRR